jgi:hypothetical protein
MSLTAADRTEVHSRGTVGAVDPRLDTDVDEISDKALAVGGGVVEAILTSIVASNAWCTRQSISPRG